MIKIYFYTFTIFSRFVIKCLIPHCERQLRLLNEIVTNRKSRSLFSGAKRWFGQGKPGVATGTSVIYGREAPELQLRKLADLFFMLKMYKAAYNHYHTAKKDFQVSNTQCGKPTNLLSLARYFVKSAHSKI